MSPLALIVLAAQLSEPMHLGDTRMECPALIAEAARSNGQADAMEQEVISALAAKHSAQMETSAAVQSVAGIAPMTSVLPGGSVMAAQRGAASAQLHKGSPFDAGEAVRARADLLLDLARLKHCAMPDDESN